MITKDNDSKVINKTATKQSLVTDLQATVSPLQAVYLHEQIISKKHNYSTRDTNKAKDQVDTSYIRNVNAYKITVIELSTVVSKALASRWWDDVTS